MDSVQAFEGAFIRTMFQHDFPSEALHALATIVAWNHIHSVPNAETRYGEVGRERAGLLRWINIEADIVRFIRGRYEGVLADMVPNLSNGARHAELISGRIRLLLVHDVDPDLQEMVPKSIYGKTAAECNQPYLIPEVAPQEPEEDLYCAVLFHSRGATGSTPSALEIRFPDGEDGYAEEHLRLYDVYPDLRDAASVDRAYELLDNVARVPEETVEDVARPIIRPESEASS